MKIEEYIINDPIYKISCGEIGKQCFESNIFLFINESENLENDHIYEKQEGIFGEKRLSDLF